MAMNIQRVNFDPVSGDSSTAAFRKLDLDIGEVSKAIDGDGSASSGISNRVASAEQKLSKLGDASTKNVGTTAGTVAAGDDPRIKTVGTTAGTLAAGDDSRFAANAAAAASAQSTASAALPLAGGTLSGNVTTAANRASLIVRSNANGIIGNATGSLGGLVVRGTGTGNAPFQTFLSDGFGSYFGVDTDNKLKWGGWSLGNIAYEIWHGGNTTVDGNNFIKRI